MSSNTGIQYPDVIDLITHRKETDEIVLIMIEERPWDGSGERIHQLQDKLNYYLSYALDGQLTQQYPIARGKPLCIQLDCVEEPDSATEHFWNLAHAQVASHGVRLAVNPLPPEDSEE